jgi:hypothetical protein
MRRLAPRNVASAQLALPKSTLRVSKNVQRGSKLKNLLNMGKHNHARYFSPRYKQIVEGLKRRFPNSELMRPNNNNGYTVGYHSRRVKDSKDMLNALRLANNGLYKNTRPGRGNNRYRYNKRYGGTLSTVSNRGGLRMVAIMEGIKRTPNGTGLMLRH